MRPIKLKGLKLCLFQRKKARPTMLSAAYHYVEGWVKPITLNPSAQPLKLAKIPANLSRQAVNATWQTKLAG
jgi:hypothetical protein